MAVCLPFQGIYVPVAGSGLDTSKSSQKGYSIYSVQRAPTDPYFYAPIYMKNVVVGSRYWIAQDSNHSTVLASGTCSSSDFTINNIPAYGNPMLIIIKVRKSSTDPKYQDYTTYGSLVSSGVTVYISQVRDNIA